ncbi:MAG: BON domain-containing protein [Anaerolineales bacterium]
MNETTTDLQTRVQRALMDDSRTREYGVEVLDNNGVIILRGIIPAREASTLVETVAREVDGVVSVINETDAIVNN